jgi:LysR family transcriptional regulator, low CO2-responsive transcriptional regulator
MRNVTIRQLQVFCEAAQGLSFARAAQRLRLSPAAISFQIKQIESMTGFALFERVGRKVALTDAGAELLVYAKTILRALHDADQTLTAQKGATGGQVTMGLVSTAKYIVPHMLTRFRERHPAIVIKLREGNRRQIIDVLTKGEIDLAIMGQPPQGADVLAEAFAAHPSVLIAAPSIGWRIRRPCRQAYSQTKCSWFAKRGPAPDRSSSSSFTWKSFRRVSD